MFVFFVNQRFHQHIQQTIDKIINIKIQQSIYIYQLVSITYYNNTHFIQKAMLISDDIIQYDGTRNNDRAQKEVNSVNQFPASFQS